MKQRENLKLVNYWLNNYVDQESTLCVLCGNTGIIETHPKSPLGVLQNKYKGYCICPNGIEMRKKDPEGIRWIINSPYME